ncbi:MAG: hypothetical protein QXH44_08430, partial [Pyrobaculum sp.]
MYLFAVAIEDTRLYYITVTKTPPYKRAKMGMARAFQVPRPFPDLTVLENVATGAVFNGGYDLKKARDVAEEA